MSGTVTIPSGVQVSVTHHAKRRFCERFLGVKKGNLALAQKTLLDLSKIGIILTKNEVRKMFGKKVSSAGCIYFHPLNLMLILGNFGERLAILTVFELKPFDEYVDFFNQFMET